MKIFTYLKVVIRSYKTIPCSILLQQYSADPVGHKEEPAQSYPLSSVVSISLS